MTWKEYGSCHGLIWSQSWFLLVPAHSKWGEHKNLTQDSMCAGWNL